MNILKPDAADFNAVRSYKIRAITYEVAAFFDESGEDVREKLLRLLKADVHRSQSAGSIAGSQVGAVE